MSENDLFKISGDGEKKDLKKILLYAAIAFVIFVIAVVGFALYKSSFKEENILPPEIKKDSSFKEIPIEKDVKEELDFNDEIMFSNEEKQNDTTFSNVSTKSQLEEKPLSNKNNFVEEKVIESSNKAAKELERKEIKKEKLVRNSYYIQVAALLKSREPDKKFLELIKKDGFNYDILETFTNINGKQVKVTKVLIGPFNSKEEAKKNLIKVKKFISKSAFIIKVEQ